MRTFYLIVILFSVFINQTTAQEFTQIADEANLGFIRKNHGVAVADFDQDGDLDIFFTGFDSFVEANPDTWNRLMKNNGDGTFEDVTIEAKLDKQFINNDIPAARGEKMGAAWGDYDNDGYPDLFLTNSREDQLYHNEGNGTFTDVTQEAGVAGCHACYSGSGLWWDHDRDGDLDLYVSVLNGPNYMYENMGVDENGKVKFIDMTYQYDMAGNGITWTSVPLDIGKDGFLDLYLVNDTQINQLYENRSGLRYNETSRANRLSDEGAGMGVAIGDYNNDGFFDIYVTNIFDHQPNPLFKNLGTRRFENVADEMGVDNSGWGWGTHFFDYDLDGDEDLYAVNGPIDKLNGSSQEDINNFFFKNMLMEGGGPFVDWSVETGTNKREKGKGMEVFDYDDDGDLDIVVANMEDKPFLFRNETIQEEQDIGKNWLKVNLEGTVSNRSAFGTEVKIITGGQSYYRWYHGAGFFGQSMKPVHFGLGASHIVDELHIKWPSGATDSYYNLTSNQTIYALENVGITDVENQLITSNQFVNTYIAPNPFTHNTILHTKLNQAGQLKMSIFSANGQTVYQTHPKFYPVGEAHINWDGTNMLGDQLPSGLYIYVLDVNGHQVRGKLIKQ